MQIKLCLAATHLENEVEVERVPVGQEVHAARHRSCCRLLSRRGEWTEQRVVSTTGHVNRAMHFVCLKASGDVYDSTTSPALNQLRV